MSHHQVHYMEDDSLLSLTSVWKMKHGFLKV